MKDPVVSVVMPVFNGARFLREAVESILGQSFGDFEFIVIDDGSTDESASILRSYEQSDRRLRVYGQENRGLIDSLNRASDLAATGYIARMDADDIAARDRLLRQLKFMNAHRNVSVIGSAVELIEASGKPLGVGRNPLGNDEIRAALLGGECPFYHSSVLMRMEAFRSAGRYRKVVRDAEDYDLWLRMTDRFPMANLGEVLLKYRIHSHQVSVRKAKQQGLSVLAAQAASVMRSAGRPDPLDSVEAITPALLTSFGISEVKQHTIVASIYLWRIRHMVNGGGEIADLDRMLVHVLSCPECRHAERWAMAELHLLRAKLYWRRGRMVKAAMMFANAIRTRPLIAARLLKPVRWRRRAGDDADRGLQLNRSPRPSF